jgi:hypothetical protein
VFGKLERIAGQLSCFAYMAYGFLVCDVEYLASAEPSKF